MVFGTDAGNPTRWTRREFLACALGGGAVGITGLTLIDLLRGTATAETFIARVPDYGADVVTVIQQGCRELGIGQQEVQGKTVLLKPNLVESLPGSVHINTHPAVVQAAIEAFRRLGAREVIVAEGPGHNRDSMLVLEESGLLEVLVSEQVRFVDLNYDGVFTASNEGKCTNLDRLVFPITLRNADWVVSLPKMKTHHWAGVTLSMKNLFGLMPGSYYGWPKNVLHWAGIDRAIVDVNATLRADLAIVDGIVGMEGDGPIMGDPKSAGVLVMGRNLPAADATCARIMGIDPLRVPHLAAVDQWLGPIDEANIQQRGETVERVRNPFALSDHIPAQKRLRDGNSRS